VLVLHGSAWVICYSKMHKILIAKGFFKKAQESTVWVFGNSCIIIGRHMDKIKEGTFIPYDITRTTSWLQRFMNITRPSPGIAWDLVELCPWAGAPPQICKTIAKVSLYFYVIFPNLCNWTGLPNIWDAFCFPWETDLDSIRARFDYRPSWLSRVWSLA
jgi:hypothetical protein